MKCVSCGAAKMVRDVRDVAHTYKGQMTTILKVGGFYCLACGESLHNAEESEYLNAAMLAFNKEVNAAIVDPDFISKTRKHLKLDQREAAEIFGGGANAFSRYENGKTKPPLSLVQLFKLLANHPELINELRTKAKKTTADAKGRLTRRKKLSV